MIVSSSNCDRFAFASMLTFCSTHCFSGVEICSSEWGAHLGKIQKLHYLCCARNALTQRICLGHASLTMLSFRWCALTVVGVVASSSHSLHTFFCWLIAILIITRCGALLVLLFLERNGEHVVWTIIIIIIIIIVFPVPLFTHFTASAMPCTCHVKTNYYSLSFRYYYYFKLLLQLPRACPN